MYQEYYFLWRHCASIFNVVTFYFLALFHHYYNTSSSVCWLTVKRHTKDNFCDLFDVFNVVWCSQLRSNIVLKYIIYSKTMLGVNCETSDRNEKLLYKSNKNDINKNDVFWEYIEYMTCFCFFWLGKKKNYKKIQITKTLITFVKFEI